MPRVINSGRNVEEWSKQTKVPISAWDICAVCKHHGRHGLASFLEPYNPKEPLGWGGRGDPIKHPTYEGTKIKCAVCATPLTKEDD